MSTETVTAEGFEYITVPERDLFDYPFGSIFINKEEFAPGVHAVSPEIAGELRRILARRLEADMRVLQPGRDRRALQDLNKSKDSVSNKA